MTVHPSDLAESDMYLFVMLFSLEKEDILTEALSNLE